MTLTKGQQKLKNLYPELNDTQLKVISKQVEERLKSGGKVGKGFLSGLANKALRGLQGLTNIVSSKENKNPDWEYTRKKGEHHQVLRKDGYSYAARFSGPGTHTLENTKELLAKYDNDIVKATRKSSYASDVDRTAHGHDLRYSLSGGDENKIREADLIFVSALNRIKDDKINTLVPKNAMIAKMLAEDQGAIKVYSGDVKHYSPADKKLLEDVLAHLEQMGFGKVEKDRPMRGGCKDCNNTCGKGQKDETIGMGKKKKPPSAWILHVKKYAKDHNMKYGEAMTKAKATYNK